MIKSLPNLYSAIGLNKDATKTIISEIRSLYKIGSRPKIKFGEEQRDDYGVIRYRDILAPQYKLKKVQKRIDYLLKTISLPDNMYGSVQKKNNILNAGEHLGHKFFLTIDLKDFFPKITSYQVFKMLYANGFSKDTARIITDITTLNGSLPQGAPSSSVIANLVIVNMVREISLFLKPFGITFTSYVDDLAFSSNTCFKTLVAQIITFINKHSFSPSYKKIHYRTGSCEITGLIVHGNQLRVTSLMQRKAYTNIHLKRYVQRVNEYNRQRIGICRNNPKV